MSSRTAVPSHFSRLGEMTVLGFIGLVLFILGQAGLVETISEQILGKRGTQEEVELVTWVYFWLWFSSSCSA